MCLYIGAIMSFGFSIGDFFAVGQLAWSVYKSCKRNPLQPDRLRIDGRDR